MDFQHRNAVLREYFAGRNWDESPEYLLARGLVLDPPDALVHYPFLFDYEWEVTQGHSQYGKGDLVFTDGEGRFAVVEVKWIDLGSSGRTARVRRTKKRGAVVEQAVRYAQIFKGNDPSAKEVVAMICTNEEGLQEFNTPATGEIDGSATEDEES